MALKSNRVGVRTDQVDVYGRVTSKSFLQSILDHLPRWTSLKVWKNGTEQLLPVNTDEPVTSPIVADIQYPTDSSATEQMFTYRESPTEADGEAYIKSIKGNTIVWNQLVDPITTSVTDNGVTYTIGSTGEIIANGTPTANGLCVYANASVNFISGHKYYLCGCPSGGSALTYRLWTESSVAFPVGNRLEDTGNGVIKSASGNENLINTSFYIQIKQAAGTLTNLKFTPQIFDLTAMFGSTKADEIYAMETAQAGSGVAYFKSLFSLPYYQYDAGSLLSFNGTGIKTVGFNQWDEEWEKGQYNASTGLPAAGNNVRCKNAIPIIPSYNYCFTRPVNNGAFNVLWYDANDNYITYDPIGSQTAYKVSTPPSNARYIRFFMGTGYGTTYKNDICINISNSSKNGSYEPYITSTTTIPTDTYFPTGMKSAGTVYDEFVSSRAYTRIGEVDLGTLDWSYYATPQRFVAAISDAVLSSTSDLANAVCEKYNLVIWANMINDTSVNNAYAMAKSGSSAYITIRDTSYTSASDFKTAMDGVMLQYELAEEIIEPTLEFDEE